MTVETKKELFLRMSEILDERIVTAKDALEAARESRDNETKSSMGDKYETGREMIQSEMEKLEHQFEVAMKLKKAIAQLNLEKECGEVEFGSLVKTNHGNYFISVSLGVLEISGKKYFTISMGSPIGQLLEGKKPNESIIFRGREIKVFEVK